MSILELSPDPPEKVSQSLLARLDVCLASGALYLENRHNGVPTAALVRGELCHEFAEKATNMLIEQGEPEMPGEVGKDLMQALIEERADFALPAHEQDACRVFAWNWASGTFLDLEAIVAVEQMFELEVGGWIVRGRIDRAEISDHEGVVRDLKSSLYVPPQEIFEKRFQTPFYGLIFMEGTPENEVPLGKGLNGVHVLEEYPRWRSDDGSIISRHAYLDRGQLHDLRRVVESHLMKLERGLATGEWAATPGTHCSTCPNAAACPIPAMRREVSTIATEGQAVEVAEQIPFHEGELKRAKSALKAWVDEHGRLVVGDEAWDFSFTRSEIANKDAIKGLIAEVGRDEEEFFSTRESTTFKKRKLSAAEQNGS